ncbi:MAG: hypothetical protein K940chlam9_01292 [Chlamydiae bacterium]|nr:hypothetical protein [Chlamydiota bacterium]
MAAGTFLVPPFDKAKETLLRNLSCHLSENGDNEDIT